MRFIYITVLGFTELHSFNLFHTLQDFKKAMEKLPVGILRPLLRLLLSSLYRSVFGGRTFVTVLEILIVIVKYYSIVDYQSNS